MPGIQIGVGHAFKYQNSKIILQRRTSDAAKDFVFVDPAGRPVVLRHEEIIQMRESNDLLDWIEPSKKMLPGPHGLTDITYDMASVDERAMADMRLDYVQTWASSNVSRSVAAITPIIEEVSARRLKKGIATITKPSPSTVLRWIKAWLERGNNADALVANTRLQGNRKERLWENVQEMMLDAIDEHYLTRNRLSIAAVHQELKGMIDEENSYRRKGEKLSLPSYDALRRAVGNLCPYTVDFCRLGTAVAKNKWRGINSGIITSHANEVWEIDDTRADVICTGYNRHGEEIVIGRPWLVVVIDRHTRMILAVVITFHPPDTETTFEAIRMALLSKDELLSKMGISGEYPARGLPDAIHVDNAKHYNSKALKSALTRLGIVHQTLPVLKPWYKGVVERAIGSISRRVFHRVPGTTFSSIFERDSERPPEQVATATIDELRFKLWHWLATSYQHKHHKGIDDTPIALWRRSMASTPERLLPTRDVIDSTLQLTITCTLRQKGLQYRNLIYTSQELVRVRIERGNERAPEVEVRIDPNNLESVFFQDPRDGVWHSAFLRADLMNRVKGRTLEEYNIVMATRLNRPPELNEQDPDWVESYREYDGKVDVQEDSEKLSERTRAAAARQRTIEQHGHMSTPRDLQKPPEGRDLASLVKEVAQATPSEGTPRHFTENNQESLQDWAERNGVKSRFRKSQRNRNDND